jgi:uncharacterized membrane protein
VNGRKRELVLFLDRQIYHFAKHWLAVFNTLTGIYVLLPLLAPLLMASGVPGLGRLIYYVYRPACHQLPERTFFLFGPQASYTLDELWATGWVERTDDIFTRQRFLGATQLGWKMALCQRDIAIYGALFVGGLLFGLLRARLKPLSLIRYLLFLVPMFIDGGTQLVGLRESIPLLRVLTGSLLGLGTVWMLYPRLDEAFADVRQQANQRVRIE